MKFKYGVSLNCQLDDPIGSTIGGGGEGYKTLDYVSNLPHEKIGNHVANIHATEDFKYVYRTSGDDMIGAKVRDAGRVVGVVCEEHEGEVSSVLAVVYESPEMPTVIG